MIWFIIGYLVWIGFVDRWYVPKNDPGNLTRFIGATLHFPAGIFVIYCMYRGFTQMNWINV